MKVFISGPMKGIENDNYISFYNAEKDLIQSGFDVFNPRRMFFTEGFTRFDKRIIDISILGICDAIYQLSGWENAPGAVFEDTFAKHSGMLYLEKSPEGFFFINKNKEEK